MKSIIFKKKLFLLCLFSGLTPLLLSCTDQEEVNITVDTTPHLNKSDSLTLVEIYNKIGPWHSPWNLNDVTTWNDVTVALDLSTNEIRVIGLQIFSGHCKGEFPEEVCRLTELRRLVISGGTMGGQIPDSIGKLKHLELFCIGDNQVTGSIPESIGEMTDLIQLDIRNTQISGPIPESIGNLTKLKWLYLFNNKLSGSIPHSIVNLKNLGWAYLQNNELTGTFPYEVLKDNPDLVFTCQDNNITELPFEVWDDDFIGTPPLLQRNRLTGEVPDWVKNTVKWKEWGQYCTGGQQEGYGYTNPGY